MWTTRFQTTKMIFTHWLVVYFSMFEMHVLCFFVGELWTLLIRDECPMDKKNAEACDGHMHFKGEIKRLKSKCFRTTYHHLKRMKWTQSKLAFGNNFINCNFQWRNGGIGWEYCKPTKCPCFTVRFSIIKVVGNRWLRKVKH